MCSGPDKRACGGCGRHAGQSHPSSRGAAGGCPICGLGDAGIALLAEGPLFAGIDPRLIPAVVERLGGSIRSYVDGDLLVHLGDTQVRTGVVLCGEVRVGFYDEEGNVSTIAQLGTGGTFGESISLADVASVVQVEAMGACRVLWIDLTKAMAVDEGACRLVMANTLRLIAHKNVRLNMKMQLLAQKHLRDRIKLYLLSRRDGTAPVTSQTSFNRSDLARYLNADRSALSRELGRLRDEGVIAFEGGGIVVVDEGFLEG